MPAATASAARCFFAGRYKKAGTAPRAAGSKAYLKSDLHFYGTTTPDIRAAANDFARKHPDLTRAELRRIVDELWSTSVFELRSAGVALLSKYSALLEERDLPWVLGFVRLSKTWAHVDWLAAAARPGDLRRRSRARRGSSARASGENTRAWARCHP